MWKRNKPAAALFVVCAIVLLWAFFPRSFEGAAHASREEIVYISATLAPADLPLGGVYTVELAPVDSASAFDDFLDLFSSRRYLPMLSMGQGSSPRMASGR